MYTEWDTVMYTCIALSFSSLQYAETAYNKYPKKMGEGVSFRKSYAKNQIYTKRSKITYSMKERVEERGTLPLPEKKEWKENKDELD